MTHPIPVMLRSKPWCPVTVGSTTRLIVAAGLLLVASADAVFAQNGGGQNGGGQNGGGQFPGGIAISPEGVVASPKAQRINPAVEQKRLKALARNNLNESMAQPSELRKVSLAALDKELQDCVDNAKPIPASVKYLAGITQIEYLFAMPETGDLVIAGPAEGFAPLQDGRVVGVESGRPVLVLDDLLTMLRLVDMNQTLGCSFDPEPSRLAQANEWNKANSSPAPRAVANQRFYDMAKVLGNWNVTVFGLPDSCHAAVTTVEADYQLKLLALGLNKPAIRGFKSHLDLAKPGENMMRRWWFAPRYNVIERSADGLAFRLSGPRLQLMTQDELIDAQGNRSDAAFKEISTERYTIQFNKHLPALCKQIPAFAATQNLFDLAVVAALIQQHNLAESTGWTPAPLVDSEMLPLTQYVVPTEVPSLVNVRSLRSTLLLGLIGGGVTMVPARVINRTDELSPENIPRIGKASDHNAWWWD